MLMRQLLPRWLSAKLWGNRERWGLVAQEGDSCWREWRDQSPVFYAANQRRGVGTPINDAGYRVMGSVELSGKRVLEIGPGDIRHVRFWRGCPSEYLLADIREEMLEHGKARLTEAGVPHRTMLLQRGQSLPVEDESIDVVVSFYSLEHIYPLSPYLEQIKRVLRPNGILIGAIPAEGGLAWGVGRMLTSRRWFKKNTQIDPDKIICWEHPNFADEILNDAAHLFEKQMIEFWPLRWLPFFDPNLVIRFIYRKHG